MARYECWLGYNTIAEANDLEELKRLLEWLVDEFSISAVTCYDNEKQEPIDVIKLLEIDPVWVIP